MLTISRYLEFANGVIAKYRGLGEAYTQISMIHPEAKAENTELVQAQQNFVTNLYRIQNIREENYLYTKNLTFLTTLLEKRFYKNLYPSVEKQVEKMIREEFHEAGKHTVENFTKVIQKFVEKEGAEKLSVLRENLLEKETHNVETKWQKEQEILFRKLENIYQSSIYRSWHTQNADQRKIEQKRMISNEQTLVFPTIREEADNEQTKPVSQSEILEQWTTILNRNLTTHRETNIAQEMSLEQLIDNNVQNLLTENINNIQKEYQESILNYHSDGDVSYQHQEYPEEQPGREIWNAQNIQKLGNPAENLQNIRNVETEKVHDVLDLAYDEMKKIEDPTDSSYRGETKNIQELINQTNHETIITKELLDEKHQENLQSLQNLQNQQNLLTENINNIHKEHQESILNYHSDGDVYSQHQEIYPKTEVHQESSKAQNRQEHPKEQPEREIWNVQNIQKLGNPAESLSNIRNAETEKVHDVLDLAYDEMKKIEEPTDSAYRSETKNIQELIDKTNHETIITKELLDEIHQHNQQNLQNQQNQQNQQNLYNRQNLLTENIRNIHKEHQESILNYHSDGDVYSQHQEIYPKTEVHQESLEVHQESSNEQNRQEHPKEQERQKESEKNHLQEHPKEQPGREIWNVQNVQNLVNPAGYFQDIRKIETEKVHDVLDLAYDEMKKNEELTDSSYRSETKNIQELINLTNHETIITKELLDEKHQENLHNRQNLQNLYNQQNLLTENIRNIHKEHQESILNYHSDGDVSQQHQEIYPKTEMHQESSKVQNRQEHPKEQTGREIWNVQKLEKLQKHQQLIENKIQNQQEHLHENLTENIQNIRSSETENFQNILNLTYNEIKNIQDISNPVQREARIIQNVLHQKYRNVSAEIKESFMPEHSPQAFRQLPPASMVYNEELNRSDKAQNAEFSRLQKQVDEVVKDLRTVEEKTVVRKKEITAKQQEIVREVLKNDSEIWSYGNGRDAIQREIHRILEDGMPESINRIAGKVYRRLEKELKMERGRRGMN